MFVRGLRRARKDKARIENFNSRWEHLTEIHRLTTKDFIEPLEPYASNMKSTEYLKFQELINDMNEWYNEINSNINQAKQSHLSRYATSIKKVAIRSIKLCKKYKVYPDIESVNYVASEKALYLNGNKHYTFG